MRKIFFVLNLLLLSGCFNITAAGSGGSSKATNQAPTGGPNRQAPQPSPPPAPATPGRPTVQNPPPAPMACAEGYLGGVYQETRWRSQSNPGSCPPAEANFSPTFPVRLTPDGTKSGGYKVEVGYANVQNYQYDFAECVANRVGCDITATCRTGGGEYQDQARFRIEGNAMVGTMARINLKSGCTMNIELKGNRP